MADISKWDYYNRRLSSLEQERTSFISHWKELSEYIEPRRGRFFVTDRNKGDRRHNKIINSRGTQALRSFQSGMFAGIMSPARAWFKLDTLDQDLMSSEEVRNWLYKVETLVRTVFLESNLYNMAPVALGELGIFGTTAMSHVDDFDNVARFFTHTAGSYYISQNDMYEVDTFALKKEMTVAQMVKKFGLDKVSESVKTAYDRANYDSWYPVCQIIEPNSAYRDGGDNSEMMWKSCWFEPGNTRRKELLREGGFEEFPVHVARWAVAGEDIYGTNSPGMVALGDIKSLQIMERRKAQAVDKLVNPPLKGPPSLRDVPVEALPGGLTIYDGDATKEGLSTLYQVDPRINEMRSDMMAVEQRINEAFFVDLFLAISAMEGIQPRNQLEISQRNEERLLMLGPPLERLQEEFLSKIVERTFGQLQRAGVVPPPPAELEGQPLNVRFISALAQAQRHAEVQTIERTAIFAGSLAQFKPEVLDKFDADEALEKYAQLTGAVPSILLSDEVVAQIRKQRAEAMAAREQAELAKTMGDAGAKVTGSLKDIATMAGGGG